MRKLLLIIQELIIVNCILGMFVFLSITVQAKGRVLDEPMAKEITGIGNYGIENPSKPIIDEAWQGNYVYFGEYDMDNDGKKEPVKYRVLSKCTTDFSGNDSTVKTMLLDCDNVFLPDGDKGMIFHELNYAVDDSKWNNSILREYLNNDFLTSSFSLQEQAAIANSVKENVAESDGDACDFQPQRWTALSGDKIFLLDAREVRNESYGYSNEQWGADNRGKICIQKPTMWEWWLRSEEEYPTLPENEGMGAGVIASKAVGCLFVNEYCGVSPVLNVRLSDILMVSIVEGTAGQTGAAYKLTLIDPAMKIRPEQSTNAQSEEQVTVPYACPNDAYWSLGQLVHRRDNIMKQRTRSVSLQIDYEEYVKADTANKKRLIIDNILESVKSVSKKEKINYSLFEEDVREFCDNNNIII